MNWWAVSGALILLATPAWAYGDPNSAGLLYQMLLPVFAVGMFFVRTVTGRIRAGVKWLKGRLIGSGDDGQTTDEA